MLPEQTEKRMCELVGSLCPPPPWRQTVCYTVAMLENYSSTVTKTYVLTSDILESINQCIY